MLMRYLLLFICGIATGYGCKNKANQGNDLAWSIAAENPPARIADIAPPEGYRRTQPAAGSFANWLAVLPLREDKTVYLYNGTRKQNQSAQFAVVDMDIGKKDLLQCADVAMKLRADWLFENKRFNEIRFLTVSGQWLEYTRWLDGLRWKPEGNRLIASRKAAPVKPGRNNFMQFMDLVYSYCGTASLAKQLEPVNSMGDIQPGDILIRGGHPGHAVLVADVAANRQDEKIYMLVQGYMPAQDIQVLNNPRNPASPWFHVKAGFPVYTPEWAFYPGALMRWK